MDTTIDPQIKNLVSAIGQAETGPTSDAAYTTKGASGEYGRYQFMPDTWKAWAGQYLGDANAPMSVENQNKVAYSQVKAWKDQGLNPAQIAAAWNAGEGSLKNDQWKTNVGTNAQGVAYNTPDYVRKVSSYYEANKAKTAAGGVSVTPAAPAGNRFLKGLGAVASGAYNAEKDVATGSAKAVVGGVQGLGQQALKLTDALGITKNQGNDTFSSDPTFLKSKNLAEGAGNVIGTVAPYFSGIGEEEALAAAPKIAEKAGSFLGQEATSLIPKAAGFAAKMGVRSVVPTTIATGQTGSLQTGAEQGIGGELGAEAITQTAARTFPRIANWLQSKALRLTPTQKRDFSSKLGAVTQWLSDNNIIGTAQGRFDKVSGIYDAMEDKLQSVFSGPAKNVTVAKQDVMDSLESLKGKYANDRDVVAIERQIDDAKAAIDRQPDQIPASNLNQLKRSTFNGAYNNQGVKVLDTVEHDIGDLLYGHLSGAMDKAGVTIEGKSLKDFNAAYSTVVTARKLLKTAIGRPASGMIAKIVSSLSGAALGSHFGEVGAASGAAIAPVITETVAGAPVRSALATAFSRVGKAAASGEKLFEEGTQSAASLLDGTTNRSSQ